MAEKNNKNEKYFASLYLAVVGDKIGFGNRLRETNYTGEMISIDRPDVKAQVVGLSNMMIYKFIAEGGITGLYMNDLSISDDTVMHAGTIGGLLENYNNRNEFYDFVASKYVESFKDITKMRDDFLAGKQTLESIKAINNGTNWRLTSYNKNAGGNGGAMRTMCLGLAFSSPKDLLKLIESSIMTCSITHPNCIAFIGSIASALFTSFALRNINVETWIFELISLLESETIDTIIEKVKPNYIEQFKEDKKVYLHKLMTYVETSFEEYSYTITPLSQRSLYQHIRMEYYYEHFSSNRKIFYPGAGGDDVIIIAYDSLMMSRNNFEKLIYFSMLNIGDSDTIGTIAAAWYGALYGFENVPLNINTKQHVFYENFREYADKMFEKYDEKNITFF